MGYSVTIQRTVFQNIDSKGDVGFTTYGIRVYDDADSRYENLSFSSREELAAATPEELIEIASEMNDATAAMIDSAKEAGAPIYIDGENVNEPDGPKI